MGRNGRNAPPPAMVVKKTNGGAAAGRGVNVKVISSGPVNERLTALEKRYASKIPLYEVYFKLIDDYFQKMFGVLLFPSPKELAVENEEDMANEANPFYEILVLRKRVETLEAKLNDNSATVGAKPTPKIFKAPVPPTTPSKAAATKRTYSTPVVTSRRSTSIKPQNAESQVKSGANQLKASSVVEKVVTIKDTSEPLKPKEKVPSSTESDEKPADEKSSESKVEIEEQEPPQDDNKKESADVETEKPLVLDQEIKEDVDSISESIDNSEEIVAEVEEKDTKVEAETPENDIEDEEVEDLEEMDVDEEYYMDEEEEDDEDFDEKPIVPTPEEIAESSTPQGRKRGPRGSKSGPSTSAEAAAVDEDEPVITYTTRGRRHKVPSRYAEFTGHDNVASILKSQQRAAAANQAAKAKKVVVEKEKPKAPSKPKASPAPKIVTPKKAPVDGSRPACVYHLITKVEEKEVDGEGNVVLWHAYPDVKVNQQQLISVIYRSNGMSTRLTRKMTTLVFEDQVLANTSPFGTKYYQERLPPESLEAMVEFIADSGFDPEYTKKKIYMIVGQVCNEARAGRVRKLLPTSGTQSGEEQISS